VIFEPTAIGGVVLVDPDRHVDERGFFARTWCADEFAAAGLPDALVQCSVSFNERRHTLRGMHWQAEPHGEGKLVRCTRGAILDVVVDLRPSSPTYLEHVGVQLDQENRRALFVPPGCAHGFLTLAERTEVFYQMDTPFVPEAARGARWDDPAFAIGWPTQPAVVSDRDRTYPDFEPAPTGTREPSWTSVS
jgi:dTDP-4-dehydrorhamnose 3,5-epimerase